jgi:hypothetical protein
LIAWLVTAGGKAPMWAVVLQLTGAALFCTVFLLLVRKIVDPRWRRVRVFGFAGGVVRRDKAGLLSSARWDEMTRAGWETHRGGSPGRTYTIDLREGRGWRLLVDDFQPGHVRALGEFVSRNRMTQRVRRPADEPAGQRPRRLAADAQHLPQWARRI